MKLIHRFRSCLGITLFQWNRWKIELWIIPANFELEEHRHSNVDIEAIFLYGHAYFHRRHMYDDRIDQKTFKSPRDMFTTLSLKAEHWHSFKTFNRRLIFIDVEKWRCTPTSASEDFVIYEQPHNDILPEEKVSAN